MKILLYLCFLDIILTLPSLPTHSSRGKVRLKTRGFSKFWKFPVFSIGNPIVMKIKVFSMGNQRIFMKISLNILLWLRHCYCRTRTATRRCTARLSATTPRPSGPSARPAQIRGEGRALARFSVKDSMAMFARGSRRRGKQRLDPAHRRGGHR